MKHIVSVLGDNVLLKVMYKQTSNIILSNGNSSAGTIEKLIVYKIGKEVKYLKEGDEVIIEREVAANFAAYTLGKHYSEKPDEFIYAIIQETFITAVVETVNETNKLSLN